MSSRLEPSENTNVFNMSMAYRSSARDVKNSLFKKAFENADQWDMNQSHWKLSKLAKELVNKTFEEFTKIMKNSFNNPHYAFWLECSLKAEKLTFVPELLKQINSKIPPDE
jgi:hypothetical protein